MKIKTPSSPASFENERDESEASAVPLFFASGEAHSRADTRTLDYGSSRLYLLSWISNSPSMGIFLGPSERLAPSDASLYGS